MFLFAGNSVLVSVAQAAGTPPLSVAQAVVWVQCADRQGSGTVINGTDGYILTNAHVAYNVDTKAVAPSCTIGFITDVTQPPSYYYHASVERYVFNTALDQDFAILKITDQITNDGLALPYPSLKTNEFSAVGDPIQILGYSSHAAQTIVVNSGIIQKFENGFIDTTAPVNPGDSGGAAIDANGNLIGMPTRVVTVTENNSATITYQLVDVRAVMNWLDTYGTNVHDQYFTHADYSRYHQSAAFIQQSSLGCTYVVRTQLATTVYCISGNSADRWVFPNDATYLSWFPDFKNVELVTMDSLADYPLSRDVTFKPGTLVKSATGPRVYVVIDNFGTMRWVTTEAKAVQLWGPNWAAQVHDVPDEFWTNYTIGQPLE